MKVNNGGAVAVWASSGMTEPGEQAKMNEALYRLAFGAGGGTLTLGELVSKAKSQVNEADLRRTWVLVGDPTIRVR